MADSRGVLETTLDEIAALTGGTVAGPRRAVVRDLVVRGEAYLDSRAPVPGGLFVALAGERADGHDHVAGAHAVLGSRPTPRPTVVVADPVVALGDLARHVVRRVRPRVLAVTGSHGKTTTTRLLAACLPGAVATRGNQNNELGVPLTALRLTAPADLDGGRTDGVGTPGGERPDLVLEMGSRGVGQLTYLAGVAPPEIAAVTAVGTSHLGRFGSRDLLARAKGELAEAVSGTCVLNADDPRVLAMASRTSADVVTFGRSGDLAWSGVRLDDQGRPAFVLHAHGASAPVRLRVVGEHQVAAAACASAMATAAGVPLDLVAERLGAAEPVAQRLVRRVAADGPVVLDDTYNAAPASVVAALRTLAAVAPPGHRHAVLGPMGELGEASEGGHRAVALVARSLGVQVVAVGEAARPLVLPGTTWVPDQAAALDVVRRLGPADTVLVKASRGARLETLVEALLAR